MKNMSPDQVASKWSQNAGAAGQYWQDGINSVTTSPGQAAAAQADVWAQNVAAARQKWQTAVAGVSLAEWKQAAITKGASRYSQGVTAGQSKYAAKIGKIMAAEKQIVGSLPPRGSVQQNIQRAVTFATAMHQAAQSGQFS